MGEAYRRRLERLDAYSDRDQAEAVYRRGKRAENLRRCLPADRDYRARMRAIRESEAVGRRTRELWRRRDVICGARYLAIVERIRAEARIRPAGKSVESERRYDRQLREALADDPEYLASCDRDARFHERYRAITRRRGERYMLAGVLAIDDRATRRAKARAIETEVAACAPG